MLAPRHQLRGVSIVAGLGVAAASGLTVSALTATAAETNTEIVVFGDSYYSTPDVESLSRPCARSEHNWPRLAAEDTHAVVHDWSCGGATSGSMVGLVKEALVAGHLGTDTDAVFISIGGNDFSHQAAVRGTTVDDLETRRDTVLTNVDMAVDIIRTTAPSAKLVFSSYLPATDGPFVCRTAGPVDGVSLPVYDEELNTVEGYISETMSIAAEQHGASFVDIRTLANGNSTCSPVGTRFLAGEDDGAADVLLSWHPTQAGARFMADQFIPEFPY